MNAIHSLTNGLFCGLLLCFAFDRAMTKPSLRAPEKVPLDPAEWSPMWKSGDTGTRWCIANTQSIRKSLLGRTRNEIRATLGPPTESCERQELWEIGPVHGGPLDSEDDPHWFGLTVVFNEREQVAECGLSGDGMDYWFWNFNRQVKADKANDEPAFAEKKDTEDAE